VALVTNTTALHHFTLIVRAIWSHCVNSFSIHHRSSTTGITQTTVYLDVYYTRDTSSQMTMTATGHDGNNDKDEDKTRRVWSTHQRLCGEINSPERKNTWKVSRNTPRPGQSSSFDPISYLSSYSSTSYRTPLSFLIVFSLQQPFSCLASMYINLSSQVLCCFSPFLNNLTII